MEGLGGPERSKVLDQVNLVRLKLNELPTLPPHRAAKEFESIRRITNAALNILKNGISQ